MRVVYAKIIQRIAAVADQADRDHLVVDYIELSHAEMDQLKRETEVMDLYGYGIQEGAVVRIYGITIKETDA